MVAEFRFTQSAVFKQYERTIYSLRNVLSTLGGLFSSLTVIGMAFTKVFSYNLMLSSLIRKLYYFKPRFESEVKKHKKQKKKQNKKKDKKDENDQFLDKKEDNHDNDDHDDLDDDEMKTAYEHYSDKVHQMKLST